jgi:hypothetical protein
MTAKEKAEELFDRIINTEHCGIKHFPNKNYCDCTEMNRFQSIQCALIAVDEIIKEIKDTTFGANTRMVNDRLDFWYEVKDEINNL